MTDMSHTRHTRPPIVTDADRQWALAQCPDWAVRANVQANDWPDDGAPDDAPPTKGGPGVLIWDYFVTGEIERFERFYYDQRKTYGDWSTLWRKSWWPKADPRRMNRKLSPKPDPKDYRTFRRGSAEFEFAIKLGSSVQRKLWANNGVVMFLASDPMVAKIEKAVKAMPETTLTPRSVAMMGDRT